MGWPLVHWSVPWRPAQLGVANYQLLTEVFDYIGLIFLGQRDPATAYRGSWKPVVSHPSPEPPKTPKSAFLFFYCGFRPQEVSRWIRTASFMQIHTFRPKFHHSEPQIIKKSWKHTQIKHVITSIFRTILGKNTAPTKILRPNPSAKKYPMVIPSLSTCREKVRLDLLFSNRIQLLHDK